MPYWITTEVDGRTTAFREPLADPFVHHRVTIHWSWRDRLRILLGHEPTVAVSIGGERAHVNAVMALEIDEAQGRDRRAADYLTAGRDRSEGSVTE